MRKIFSIEDLIDTENNSQLYKIIHLLGFKIKFKRLIYKRYLKLVSKLANQELGKIDISEKDKHSSYVFTMWLQDEIPEIIEMCLDTIKKQYPNVILLNEKNIEQYVDVPEYIYKKYKSGKIIPAHFSDYVRCCLLDKYGGLWLDASLYMLDKIPKFITNQDFFILTGQNKKSVSNFFLYSTKNNYIIKCLKIFLEQYWKDNDIADNYFFWHRTFRLFNESDPMFNNCYKKSPIYYNTIIKYLSVNTNIDFDMDLWKYLKNTSFMYKINRKNINAMSNENSFNNYLLNAYRERINSTKNVANMSQTVVAVERERERERE